MSTVARFSKNTEASDKSDYRLLRWSLAIVFIWFGALKPLGLSPASDLVAATVPWIPAEFFVPFLGYWEIVIGIGLLYRPLMGASLVLMGIQMLGTFLPFVLLPSTCFEKVPFVLTLTGQYIVKNLVFISAGIMIAVREFQLKRGNSSAKW